MRNPYEAVRPFPADRVRDRAVWSFETEHFLIAFEPEPEDVDPADCFEFAEDIETARSGEPHDWFCAVVNVYAKRNDGTALWIADDTLGACSYASFHDFVAGHRDRDPMNRNCSLMRAARGDNVVVCHYFPDMVRTAVRNVRERYANGCSIRLRTAA